MTFYLTLCNWSWLSSSNWSPAFSTKCHCTVNLITAVRAVHFHFLLFVFTLSSSYFPDIGGGGKRKPPPMHRKRRLREPVKIHRRRIDCIIRAVVPSVRLYKHSFSGFLATLPMSAGAAVTREHTLARPLGSAYAECPLRSKASAVHFVTLPKSRQARPPCAGNLVPPRSGARPSSPRRQ